MEKGADSLQMSTQLPVRLAKHNCKFFELKPSPETCFLKGFKRVDTKIKTLQFWIDCSILQADQK